MKINPYIELLNKSDRYIDDFINHLEKEPLTLEEYILFINARDIVLDTLKQEFKNKTGLNFNEINIDILGNVSSIGIINNFEETTKECIRVQKIHHQVSQLVK